MFIAKTVLVSRDISTVHGTHAWADMCVCVCVCVFAVEAASGHKVRKWKLETLIACYFASVIVWTEKQKGHHILAALLFYFDSETIGDNNTVL